MLDAFIKVLEGLLCERRAPSNPLTIVVLAYFVCCQATNTLLCPTAAYMDTYMNIERTLQLHRVSQTTSQAWEQRRGSGKMLTQFRPSVFVVPWLLGTCVPTASTGLNRFFTDLIDNLKDVSGITMRSSPVGQCSPWNFFSRSPWMLNGLVCQIERWAESPLIPASSFCNSTPASISPFLTCSRSSPALALVPRGDFMNHIRPSSFFSWEHSTMPSRWHVHG